MKSFFILIFFTLSLFAFNLIYHPDVQKVQKPAESTQTPQKQQKPNITPPFVIDRDFSYRKYSHVKSFYKEIAKKSVEIGLKYDIPPAAILAIAGIESGYGRGYVSKITGNILSLGARSNEAELPALFLPEVKKTKEVLVDPNKIAKYTSESLTWKKRPKSLKKDYRPQDIAGTSEDLHFFIRNKNAFLRAKVANMTDFAKVWISHKSNIPAFKEARLWLDTIVQKGGKKMLFEKAINEAFIDAIGGKKLSFNYRKTWPIKVKSLMDKAGLVELTSALHAGHSFEKSW